MTLDNALRDFAVVAGIDPDVLIGYANEDEVGGFPESWETGSLWAVEGKFLYAVVRALGATRILEIGTHVGCSATHLLTAAHLNEGTVTSVDIWQGAGQQIPVDLRSRWEQVNADAVDWLTRNPERRFDVAFEDGSHEGPFTEDVVTLLQRRGTRVIISHDSEHATAGPVVKGAWLRVYGEHGFTSVLIEPSDCGLAWRVNPDYDYSAQLEG